MEWDGMAVSAADFDSCRGYEGGVHAGLGLACCETGAALASQRITCIIALLSGRWEAGLVCSTLRSYVKGTLGMHIGSHVWVGSWYFLTCSSGGGRRRGASEQEEEESQGLVSKRLELSPEADLLASTAVECAHVCRVATNVLSRVATTVSSYYFPTKL